MWYNVLHTRNMWFNTLWYNNHMLCNSVWYTIIPYVTGVLYNMWWVLFTPLATVQYFGALTSLLHRSLLHPCHLVWPGWISPGCCGPVARLVTVTWWHAALQLQPSSYNFKLMIGKLEGGDWPLSPRGQGWALYVRMGCMQNFGRPRG